MYNIHQKRLLLDYQKPEIIIPVIAKNEDEILNEVTSISKLNVFGIEWRIDAYEHFHNRFEILQLLKEMRSIIKDKVLLVTIRTSDEGGLIDICNEDYASMYQFIIESGYVDFVDFEVQRIKQLNSDIVTFSKHHDVGIILSYHNFERVDEDAFLRSLLHDMKTYQPTIYKFALMPQSSKDMYHIYELSKEFYEEIKSPMVFIAMSELGKISRYQASSFHSCLTFAALENTSAPGQIAYAKLEQLLSLLADL